jgi:O-antigen ligase
VPTSTRCAPTDANGSIERLLAFLFAAVPVAALAAVDGGFFAATWPWATMGLAAAGGIALLLRQHLVLGRLDLLTLAALAAFTAWTALSALWSDDGTASISEAERALLYLSGLLAALLVLRRETIGPLLTGLVTAITGIAIISLGLDASRPGSLEGPVGYANALGILVVLGLLLLPAVVARGTSWVERVASAACVPVLVATLLLTDSRGAWGALFAGLVVAFAVARPRWALAGLPIVALAAVAALNSMDLGDRPYYWRAAWSQYETSPLLGTGAGTFDEHWLLRRPEDLTVLDTPQVVDAHSIYVETLAELGPLGLALATAALFVPLVGVLRRREPWVPGVAGAYGAYLVHAGLDWDWEMPAVTLSALFCASTLLTAARHDQVRLAARSRVAMLAFLGALIGLSLLNAIV